MLILLYYNWKGTDEERKKYEAEVKDHWSKVEGVTLKGMYTPTIPWNRAWFFKTDSYDLLMKKAQGKHPLMINTDMVIFTE